MTATKSKPATNFLEPARRVLKLETEGLRALSDSLDPVLRDQFQDMIQECHNEELPNDWRYSIVKRLSWTFAESLDNRFEGTDENERDFLLDETTSS